MVYFNMNIEKKKKQFQKNYLSIIHAKMFLYIYIMYSYILYISGISSYVYEYPIHTSRKIFD